MDREAQLVAEAFGFCVGGSDVASLSPYGAVYRLRKDSRFWVLKRTGYPNSRTSALQRWLQSLAARGIRVVSAAHGFDPNPRSVEGARGDWVIYPYIDGGTYRGERHQIAAAGRLLGQMHLAGAELGEDLLCREYLPIHGEDWRAAEIHRATSQVDSNAPELAKRFHRALAQHHERHGEAIKRLSRACLPLSACSWDFKASNLVFLSDGAPVLVDPDHGGRIPRIYDLACCALLFHADCAAAPSRLFTGEEWDIFLGGYLECVEFAAIEHRLWRDVLVAAWMDQALWLIGNWPEGWASSRDRMFLEDIATTLLTEIELRSE